MPYDSSADWFSLGCMLYKLLKGHSPFRQHKTKDKHEIDRMTMTMNVELPNHFTMDLKLLLEGLLQRDVDKRLGCRGKGADEVKQHPFFHGIDWQMVYLQKYNPPLVPPRGEVNAADAFDIGSFDEEDTRGIKLDQSDQDQYKDFSITVSERWQNEIADTVFDTVNQETDKLEQKKRTKLKFKIDDEKESDCIIHGHLKKLGGPFQAISSAWQVRYCKLYPNRLELHSDAGKPELIFMDQIEEINPEKQQVKEHSCIVMKLKNDRDSVKITLGTVDEIAIKEWLHYLCNTHKTSVELMATIAKKATRVYLGDTTRSETASRPGATVIQPIVGSSTLTNFSNLAAGSQFNGNLIGNSSTLGYASSPVIAGSPLAPNPLSSLSSAPSPISTHHLHQPPSPANTNLVLASPNQAQISPIATSHLQNLASSPNTGSVAPSGILNRNSNW